VKDVDYALALLQRQLQGMSQEELAKFDEDKFFTESLRKTHPYLYGESVQPVTTSPTGDPKAPPTPPAPRAPTPPPGGTKKASEMTRTEYYERLNKLGLTPPQHGSPS
jgi:hypothetical protein